MENLLLSSLGRVERLSNFSPLYLHFFVVLIFQYRIHISLSLFSSTLHQLGLSVCLVIFIVLQV